MTTGPKGQVDSCQVILIFYCFRTRDRGPETRDCSNRTSSEKYCLSCIKGRDNIFSGAKDLRWHSENEKFLRAMKEYLLAEI